MPEVESTIKTENTLKLLEEAKKYSPGGVQGDGRWYEPYPLFIKKALGSRIWDVDDNEYIDYHASYGPVGPGLQRPPGAQGGHRDAGGGGRPLRHAASRKRWSWPRR